MYVRIYGNVIQYYDLLQFCFVFLNIKPQGLMFIHCFQDYTSYTSRYYKSFVIFTKTMNIQVTISMDLKGSLICIFSDAVIKLGLYKASCYDHVVFSSY